MRAQRDGATKKPMNASQRWVVFIGVAIAAIGVLLAVMPVHATVGLQTADCGSPLDRLTGATSYYDECDSSVGQRTTLAAVVLIGGAVGALAGREFFADRKSERPPPE